MAKYRVTMVEETYYKIYVEASTENQAAKRAICKFNNGGGEIVYSDVVDVDVEEEM